MIWVAAPRNTHVDQEEEIVTLKHLMYACQGSCVGQTIASHLIQHGVEPLIAAMSVSLPTKNAHFLQLFVSLKSMKTHITFCIFSQLHQ